MPTFSARTAIPLLALSMLAAADARSADSVVVSPAADQPATRAPAERFTGVAHISAPFRTASPARVGGATVTFEPGARTHWHTHPLGQTLVVLQGQGWVQQSGGAPQAIARGDTVWIPPGVKHWHGAGTATSLSHVAIAEALDGTSVTWLEAVEGALPDAAPNAAQAASAPSAGQRTFGDVAPKMAQLTDEVLFGDVWARPGLSPRDRSVVTIAALIAMNRPEQFKPHRARALDNGVTREEIAEVITHLAFYAGWPSAVTATGVAREVFAERDGGVED